MNISFLIYLFCYLFIYLFNKKPKLYTIIILMLTWYTGYSVKLLFFKTIAIDIMHFFLFLQI